MSFSKRSGIKSAKPALQIATISDELNNIVWNSIQTWFANSSRESQYFTKDNVVFYKVLKSFWSGFLKRPFDQIPEIQNEAMQLFREIYFNLSWFEVYDLIEFALNNFIIISCDRYDFENQANKYVKCFNQVFEEENAGYRFIDYRIIQISNETEISSIEQTLSIPYIGVQQHLKEAISCLADKKNKNFRNSIKESICAVEAICREVLNDKSVTLGRALDQMQKTGKLPAHEALKSAFTKLYGFTSDSNGIRHAMMDDSSLDYEDAKYMLVVCSAFCNLVIGKNKN